VAKEGPRFLTVSPELLERQLDLLRRRGLRTGGLAELEAAASGGLSERTVFLTFDDGFLDNFATVLPLLRERGLKAFVFVLPPLADDDGPLAWPEVAEDQRRFGATMRSVGWAMLEEMKEGGFEIGSHTLTHGHLAELDPEQLREELAESRRRIVERLGSCDVLAYPFGEWNREVEEAAADCGYRFAFTLPTRAGQRHATPLSIPRINVDYRDRGLRFSAKLTPIGKRIYLGTAVAALRRRRKPLK
jgi:peptidoglycan/xylan/chitin deacetylase (PgdA/CDA1 family)